MKDAENAHSLRVGSCDIQVGRSSTAVCNTIGGLPEMDALPKATSNSYYYSSPVPHAAGTRVIRRYNLVYKQ